MKYILGVILIIFSLVILGGTYFPLLRQEISYDLHTKISDYSPVDTNFGIVIPKIGANAHVIKNVDPFNSQEYQRALSRGVAHAKGTALPGQKGNLFLFSHSSADFINAAKYNSIFYLLTKLEMGDQIRMYYLGQEYVYVIQSKDIVNSNDIQYLTGTSKVESLTLMTCWPPGTSLKRLIVIATRQSL